jgi:hypothetical protein
MHDLNSLIKNSTRFSFYRLILEFGFKKENFKKIHVVKFQIALTRFRLSAQKYNKKPRAQNN